MGQQIAKLQNSCCHQAKNEQKTPEKPLDKLQEPSPAVQKISTRVDGSSIMEQKSLRDIDAFKKIKIIGKGAFGIVYLVKKNNPMSKKFYAMKQIKKNNIDKYKLHGYISIERDILLYNKHNFIVDLKYSFQTEYSVFLVMEFIQGGSLYNYLSKITKLQRETVAQFVIAEVILALEKLHNGLNVIYRDMKPENILITKTGHVKLTDFGLSSQFDSEQPNQKYYGLGGTMEYMTPEMIQNYGWDKNIDFWCIGILLYEMLVGQCPFIPANRQRVTTSFAKKVINIQILFPSFVSEKAKSLIKALLQFKPEDRLGANDFEDLKQHEFFQGIDWTDLALQKVTSPLESMVNTVVARQNVNIQKIQPRPIIDTYIDNPNMQIQGLSYKPEIE